MELINKAQRFILSVFGKIPGSQEFYLTGGTALSYFYLKHRQSNDLDFFTPVPEVIVPFSQTMEKTLKDQGCTVGRQRSFHSFVELLVTTTDSRTIIQLAQDSAFRLDPTRLFPEFTQMKVDSLPDIAANKLLALFGRAAPRDFFDVYCLIKEAAFDPENLVAKAKQKDPGFDLYWLGIALQQAKNIPPQNPELSLSAKEFSFEDFQSFFADWDRHIANSLR